MSDQTKTGIDLADLRWLEAQGGLFCKVSTWNSTRESPGKNPDVGGGGWQTRPLTTDQVLPHLKSGGNVGLICGSLSGNIGMIDADEDFSDFLQEFPLLANVPTVKRAGADKGKILIRIKGPMPGGKKWYREGEPKPYFEWLSDGNQGVIPPSKHPSGVYYELVNHDRQIYELTPEALDDICFIFTGESLREETPAVPMPAYKRADTQPHQNGDGLREAVLAAWPTLEIFRHFGRVTETRMTSKGEWLKLRHNGGLFVHCEGGQPGDGWSLPGVKDGGGPFEAWWWCKFYNTKVPKDRGFYDLLREMAVAGGVPIPENTHQAQEIPPEPEPDFDELLTEEMPEGDQAPNPVILHTELGNSRRFSRRYKAQLRFTAAWGWMIYDGKRWAPDETGGTAGLAKAIVDDLFTEALAELEGAKLAMETSKNNGATPEAKAALDEKLKNVREFMAWAMKSQAAQKIAAMIGLAESDLPARAEDFDLDPWALNCQNGIINLTTGVLQPHHQRRMIRKLAPVDYDPAALAPTWDKFLTRIFGGDQELIGYIRRAVGYSLTGSTSEQCFFFLYGKGNNGKSTFTGALAALLGDYYRKAAAQTFMQKKYSQGGPSEGLANLAGARFVVASELSEDMKFDEPNIKDLTGGDLYTARRLYKDEFTFQPALKLWLYGNSKPDVSGTDEGIWRRVRLVPFEVIIPAEEIDKTLPSKLAGELPGILAWAVRGCLEWQREGLGMPEAIKRATSDYRKAEDIIGQFIEDCCVEDPKAQTKTGELYAAYTKWGGQWKIKAFSQAITRRGYKKVHTMAGACVTGLGLLHPVIMTDMTD